MLSLEGRYGSRREVPAETDRDFSAGLEGDFDCSLKDTWAADAVDIADATAEKSGYFAKRARSEGGSRKTECGCVGQVEGIEAGLERRLAEDREAFEEGEIV